MLCVVSELSDTSAVVGILEMVDREDGDENTGVEVIGLDKVAIDKVKRWLRSIPKTELAIYNLELAIKDLDEQIKSPPTHIISGIGNYSGMFFDGGEEGHSKQQSYTDWLETCENRMSFLQDHLKKKKRKMEQYYTTLEQIKQEPNWGYMGGEIIRKKYFDKVKPDVAIYTMFVFCSREEFYRAHKKSLKYFFDVLPDVFME